MLHDNHLPGRHFRQVFGRYTFAPITGSKRKIVAIVGQSNAVGQGDSTLITNDAGLTSPLSSVRHYQITSQGPAPSDPITWSTGSPGSPVVGSLAPYTSSVANIAGATTTCMGPELALGHYLDEVLSNQTDLVTFAVSGTSIASHWLPTSGYPTSGSGGVNLFHQMIAALQDAEARLSGQIVTIIWIQGESDAQNATDAGNYQTNLQATFNAIRTYYSVPIIFNQLSSGCAAANTNTVRTAQAAVQAATSNCYMFSVDDLILQTDNYHFNTNSYNVLGFRLGAQVLSALGITDTHSWTVDATSGKGMPRSAKEWETALKSFGLVGMAPQLQWDLTVANGNVTDLLQMSGAAATGTATGTGMTYQSSAAGWSTLGISINDGATAKFATASGTLPNPSVDACAALMYMKLNATPAAIRTPLLMGTTTFNARIDVTAPAPHFRTDSGVQTAPGTQNPTGGPRPYMIANDPSGSNFGCTDQEFVAVTRGSPTGKQFGFGFTASPNAWYGGLMTVWGPRTKWTQAKARNLLQGLNWTLPSTGTNGW